MAPEFNPKIAEGIIKDRSIGKFVRQGDSIWVDPDASLSHDVLARDAGFTDVEDAGLFVCMLQGNGIAFLGNSTHFNNSRNGLSRDKTILVAQEAVGGSAKIIKR